MMKHIRIEETLKAHMDAHKGEGTYSDLIKRALVAQARFDAGAKKSGTITTGDVREAANRLERLLEL